MGRNALSPFNGSNEPERPEPVQRVEWVKTGFVFSLFWIGVTPVKIGFAFGLSQGKRVISLMLSLNQKVKIWSWV
jgi:hypothetical protein